jgi:uncharacterized protein YjbI with pentapeptide repeats
MISDNERLAAMSNSEHLAKLNEGVGAWNDWRKANPDIIPDLREADLFAANLSGADVSGAILRSANLTGADLDGTDLSWAYMSFTILGDNDLSGVKGLETRAALGSVDDWHRHHLPLPGQDSDEVSARSWSSRKLHRVHGFPDREGP